MSKDQSVAVMKKYAYLWVQDWCSEHGWTDLFLERYHYWAFPPGAVLPQPIPFDVLHAIKREKGLSPTERLWYGAGLAIATLSALGSYVFSSPLPLVLAFSLCALTVAYLEEDERP
jgi:hypothetical protein